jgi:hypothetical protein
MIIGSVFGGLFTYSILSYLLVSSKITIPLSIVFPILIFGLTKYYSRSDIDINKLKGEDLTDSKRQHNDITTRNVKNVKKETSKVSSILFVAIFAISILISFFAPQQEFHIFIKWNEIGSRDIIQLGSAIVLCFFLPGYAIVLIITKESKMDPILQVLLAYLLSILTTGLTSYVSALFFDKAITESKYLFIAVYLTILASFLIFYPRYKISQPINLQAKKLIAYESWVNTVTAFWKSLKIYSSELLVFGSILMLLVIATYYLFDGTTIGDQWYHQGRALLFMSGSFREAALSEAEVFYTPFQSAVLASLTTLSGIPLVNSYVSIAFLNMTLIFAFYYFFLSWVPSTMWKSGILAASLFAISAGFGWIYLLNTVTTHPILSPHSSIETLAKMGPLDIISSSNFLITTAPQFSTGLTYIALPAGFVLLGALRTRFHNTFTSIAIVSAVSVLGMVSHDEFYIFIIIASLLPVIFRMGARNYMYFGFIVASLIVYTMDIIGPSKFFTSNEIFGFPLILLSLSFVVLTWSIYLTIGHLRKVLKPKLTFLHTIVKLQYHVRFKFLTQVSVVSLVAYLYLLSFIVLSQLPLQTIIDQTQDNTIPWYLYPMRMGTAGLLGLAFILSFLFGKFEKELFVFGILVVISFITGPYYDEHRFSKYIMAGMIGFASLMIYNILNQRFRNKPLVNSVLLGIIITSSGLSTLLYIGYNSLILQTQDFINTLARRHFPSVSELHLFEILHNRIDIDSKKYNVMSFLNEYNRLEDGVMAKIPAFSGLPYDKLRQSPLTLNASTLDTLYHHLAYSDARYIIIPKDSIRAGSVVTEPTRFVLEHFSRVFEDDNYILLEIPPLTPPSSSSKAEIALIYNKSDDSVPEEVSDTYLLQFDNKTYDFNGNENSITIQKDNLTQVLDLLGTKMDKGITIWSKNISADKTPNYIEARFQIVSENKNKSNDVRVEWQEGDRGYYVKLSNDGLELYQMSKDNQYKKILLKNTDLEKKNSMWYNLKVESIDDWISIYLNDELKIKAPRTPDNNTEPISNVGLTTYYNDVEFKPVKIGTVSNYPQKIDNQTKYYNYYYPLSLLALSNSSYDVFSSSDSSVFSKDVIFVSDSLKYDNVTLKEYLDYVREGGTLIVVESQNNSGTVFNQLFSLKSTDNKEETFTSITGDKNQQPLINVSGLVNRINMTSSPGIELIASYRNNKNETIAPFIIERNFSSGGKIILLNFNGYFNSISNSPTQYFFTLSNISQLLPVDLGKGTISQNTSIPAKGFTGKMQIYGKVRLNSSSLSLPYENSHPYVLNTSRIAIYKNGTNIPIVLNNVSIKDLKLMGDYVANIDISGPLELPDMRTSRDYIGVQIPSAFNMTIRLSPKGLSQMEIVTQNQTSMKSFKVNNDSRIEFYGIKPALSGKSIPVLLKRPEMKVDGHILNKHTYLYGFVNERGRLHMGVALDLQGHLETKFDLVDKFDQHYRNATRTTYITYLQALAMNGTFDEDKDRLNLPGDIYFKAKERGQEIPLEKILSSPGNIITLMILIPIIIITSIFIWRKKNL